MLRFFLLFFLIQSSLFAIELLQPVQQALIIPWTEQLAHSSVGMMKLFDDTVFAQGVIIRTYVHDFAVAIRPGCNGVEAVIILIAAILAFPAPWLNKIAGIAIGFVTVQGVNFIRIISLFYLGQWNTTIFELVHQYLWEVLIMLDVLITFLVWLHMLPSSSKTSKHVK